MHLTDFIGVERLVYLLSKIEFDDVANHSDVVEIIRDYTLPITKKLDNTII